MPPSPEPPSPQPRPSDLIALVHFVVDELQQEPHDVAQDEGGDQIPVNHVPQTADTPVGGPGQGSAGIGSEREPLPRAQETAGTAAPEASQGPPPWVKAGLQQEPHSPGGGHSWISRSQLPSCILPACQRSVPWPLPRTPLSTGFRAEWRRDPLGGEGKAAGRGGVGATHRRTRKSRKAATRAATETQ